jgi:DNA-binding beta-propeller fold protein YncE
VNVDGDSVVGQVPPDLGHDYAIASDIGAAITRHGAVFDLNTFNVRAAGTALGGVIAYDLAHKRALLFGEDTTEVIDAITGKVIQRVPLVSDPMSAAADGAGHILVDVETDSLLLVNVDPVRVQVSWGLGSCHGPHGIALDVRHHRVFVSCDNNELEVLDSQNGHVVATLPIGGPAYEIAFDSVLSLVYNPNGNGTMTLIAEKGPDEYAVVAQVPTAEGDPIVAVDEVTHKAYVLRVHTAEGRARVLVFVPQMTTVHASSVR